MTQVVEIPLSKLDDGTNVRERTDDGLHESIGEHGVLQPITVARLAGGRFEVLYGHRRVAAARRLGLEAIPAIVVDRPEHVPIRQLVENLDRKAMDPLDVASALKAHMDATGLNQSELARKLRRPQSWVNRKMLLLGLPEETQAAVSAGEVSEITAIRAHRAGQPPNEFGRPKTFNTDEGDSRSRSVIVPLGEGLASATVGVDPEAHAIDLVVQDSRGRGVLLSVAPDKARLLGRRLVQAGEAVRA